MCVTLRSHSANISTFVLKEVRTDNGEGCNSTPHRYFRTVQWFLYTVSMNPLFLVKFTLGGNVAAVVLIKWFYGESTLCTSPRLHFKLNAIHGHANWQHHFLSLLALKIEKRRCQIARFTGWPCRIKLEQKIWVLSVFYSKWIPSASIQRVAQSNKDRKDLCTSSCCMALRLDVTAAWIFEHLQTGALSMVTSVWRTENNNKG